MLQLQTKCNYVTKTHLADILRRVSTAQDLTITQRGILKISSDISCGGCGAYAAIYA
jgi:hypothetical protein